MQCGPAQGGTARGWGARRVCGEDTNNGAEIRSSSWGEVTQGIQHHGKPDLLARGKGTGQAREPDWAGTEVGSARALTGAPGVDWAMWVLALLCANQWSRQLCISPASWPKALRQGHWHCTPPEEAAHQALATGKRTCRKECVLVLSLSFLSL